MKYNIFACCTLSATQVDGPRPEGDGVNALLDQARNAGDPFLAVTLYQRVLQARPNDTTVMGEAADLMLHAGETEAAKEVRPFGLGERQPANNSCEDSFF